MIAGGIGPRSRGGRGSRGYEADDAQGGVPAGVEELAFQSLEAPSKDTGLAGFQGGPQAFQAPQLGGAQKDLDLGTGIMMSSHDS